MSQIMVTDVREKMVETSVWARLASHVTLAFVDLRNT
jgi:hypothetical protein